ncbi:hypothetical protein C7A11_14825 [Pseudomonas simiae]|nr:hypothetical protein C7A11_14825 [Pseudomonas simiae]
MGTAHVGAGLPAMQTPRSLSQTEVMLSQASQLLHKPAPTFDCVQTYRPALRSALRIEICVFNVQKSYSTPTRNKPPVSR